MIKKVLKGLGIAVLIGIALTCIAMDLITYDPEDDVDDDPVTSSQTE